jgi:hypothetical protein
MRAVAMTKNQSFTIRSLEPLSRKLRLAGENLAKPAAFLAHHSSWLHECETRTSYGTCQIDLQYDQFKYLDVTACEQVVG